MKILNLTEDSYIYTSNAFLVTGTWNKISDTNTLIDVGRDPVIIEKINNAATGVGKHKVDQVILTHSHYDHAGMIKTIKQEFKPKILAFSESLEGVDKVLVDGEFINVGDQEFEVIHMPGHSNDSICLYGAKEKVLFAGDSPLIIKTWDGNYEDLFVRAFRRIAALPISTIYFGHGRPMNENCNEVLERSLKNLTTVKNDI